MSRDIHEAYRRGRLQAAYEAFQHAKQAYERALQCCQGDPDPSPSDWCERCSYTHSLPLCDSVEVRPFAQGTCGQILSAHNGDDDPPFCEDCEHPKREKGRLDVKCPKQEVPR